jgi:hypothetical protein
MYQNEVEIDNRTLVHRSEQPMTHLVVHQLPDETVVHRLRIAKANGDQLRIANFGPDAKLPREHRRWWAYAWCASETEAQAARNSLIDCASDHPHVKILPCRSAEVE